jgi:hypothetical protein
LIEITHERGDVSRPQIFSSAGAGREGQDAHAWRQ